LNRDQKAQVIEEVAGAIQESNAIFAVDYRGISVPQAAELRTTLRAADATFRVVKNTLSERAADQVGADAQLPSRDVLIGRLVGMIASPLSGLATALNNLPAGLARQLQQIHDKGLIGGGAAPAETTSTETPTED
jgi:large subunit ribosomal protein L10